MKMKHASVFSVFATPPVFFLIFQRWCFRTTAVHGNGWCNHQEDPPKVAAWSQPNPWNPEKVSCECLGEGTWHPGATLVGWFQLDLIWICSSNHDDLTPCQNVRRKPQGTFTWMVMVRSSPQKILRHLGSSWCEWLAGTRWPDFFVVQFQSISSLWAWKLERPKEELARYGDFSCVLCHFHDWKCQVGFVSLGQQVVPPWKKGVTVLWLCQLDVAVERCRSDGRRDKAVEAAQASGITVKDATCSLRPETYEPEADWQWCSKKLYLFLVRWMIVYCSDMVI